MLAKVAYDQALTAPPMEAPASMRMAYAEMAELQIEAESSAADDIQSDPDREPSPELFCVGCGMSSKMDCPIEKEKGDKTRLAWARTTTRNRNIKVNKVRKTLRKKIKVRCGEWCGICPNVAKIRFGAAKNKGKSKEYAQKSSLGFSRHGY